MASVQRLMMYATPVWALDIMCRVCPKTVIGLLCHWANEKNPNIEERRLAKRLLNLAQVGKKFSKLSNLGILYLLKQDESLWKMYIAGVGIITFPDLPALLLQLMFELGGQEGRERVRDIIARMRVTIGGGKQAQILEYFSTDTVLDLFEMLPAMEVSMRLRVSSKYSPEVVAIWLTHWDLRKEECEQDKVSKYWIMQLPAGLAFEVEKKIKEIELRRPFVEGKGGQQLKREQSF